MPTCGNLAIPAPSLFSSTMKNQPTTLSTLQTKVSLGKNIHSVKLCESDPSRQSRKIRVDDSSYLEFAQEWQTRLFSFISISRRSRKRNVRLVSKTRTMMTSNYGRLQRDVMRLVCLAGRRYITVGSGTRTVMWVDWLINQRQLSGIVPVPLRTLSGESPYSVLRDGC